MSVLKKVLEISKNTSPGPDNIANILIKQLPNSAHEVLLKIYNIMWQKKVFPKIWKQAVVIPLPKPNKNKYEKNNYRPIALTCCTCKLLEKIVNKRLCFYLETNNLLNKHQSGFREICSTLLKPTYGKP